MKIFINQDSKKFVSSQKFNAVVNRFDFKRGDTHLIEIGFVENSLLVPLVGPFVITFALKESGKYDGSFLVSETNFVLNGSTGFFQGTPNFNTVELNDLLNANDGDDTNDVPYADCLFEISVSDDNGISSSATSVGRVYHDVIKGDEGVPISGTPVYPPASEITDHIADTTNPHSVTASQVGAVDLTTAQTIAGAKTWSGQQEATGQAASTDDSVLTRTLGDARYKNQTVYTSTVASGNAEVITIAKSDFADANENFMIDVCCTYFDNSAQARGSVSRFYIRMRRGGSPFGVINYEPRVVVNGDSNNGATFAFTNVDNDDFQVTATPLGLDDGEVNIIATKIT